MREPYWICDSLTGGWALYRGREGNPASIWVGTYGTVEEAAAEIERRGGEWVNQ